MNVVRSIGLSIRRFSMPVVYALLFVASGCSQTQSSAAATKRPAIVREPGWR